MQLIQKITSYRAGRYLHGMLLMGVLRAPMSFFDKTPMGRIINRFSKDMESIDTSLPDAISQTLATLVTVITTVVILLYGSWLAVLQLIPLSIIFLVILIELVAGKLSISSILVFFFTSVYTYHLHDNCVDLIL